VSNREREEKGAAASGRKLRPDAPAVGLDDPPAGGEADSAASCSPPPRLNISKMAPSLGRAIPLSRTAKAQPASPWRVLDGAPPLERAFGRRA
jgi:hypothetical protein